jgi:hypothetical protein
VAHAALLSSLVVSNTYCIAGAWEVQNAAKKGCEQALLKNITNLKLLSCQRLASVQFWTKGEKPHR